MATGTRSLFLLLLLLLVLVACSESKKEKQKLNIQNCTRNATFSKANITNIYYNIVSNDSSDACMHFVWSMVQNPTLFVAQTTDPKQCTCNASSYDPSYPTNQNGTISIPGLESAFSLTIVFTRLIEFNGTTKYHAQEALDPATACNETAFESNSNYTEFYLSRLNWAFLPNNFTFVGSFDYNDTVYKNATRFSIRTNIPEFVGSSRLKYFPKTHFTENSTTFDIISENYRFNDTRYNLSRLALEVILIHGKNVRNGSIVQVKTTDDEYTPSVFSTYTYNTSGSGHGSSNESQGYFQWKPISYEDANRKSTSSQQVNIVSTGSFEVCQLSEVPLGLASALHGTEVGENVGNVTRWFAVFGTSGDGTDTNPSYNTWTVVTGTGDVPVDKFSFVVIITIIVGAGIPVALVLLGGVYIFIRKKPWQNIHRWVNSRSGRGYSRLS